MSLPGAPIVLGISDMSCINPLGDLAMCTVQTVLMPSACNRVKSSTPSNILSVQHS